MSFSYEYQTKQMNIPRYGIIDMDIDYCSSYPCYKLYTRQFMSWKEAEDVCKQKGANLLSVNTYEEWLEFTSTRDRKFTDIWLASLFYLGLQYTKVIQYSCLMLYCKCQIMKEIKSV